jgi:hypothetical protein
MPVMSIAELFKKNFVLIPVIASVLFGTFTGVKYIVNLTDTINQSETHIVNLERDLKVASDKVIDEHKTIFCRSNVVDGREFISNARR